jgi:predicted DNA-binding protein (MmcQ/YjbR family)
MTYAEIEAFALGLPGATLKHEFGPAPVFRVGGRLFLVITLDARGRPDGLWFKAGPRSFHILTRLAGISPCPSLTRAHWVAMDGLRPLKGAELKAYIVRSHAQVAAKLPRRMRQTLGIKDEPCATPT